MADSNRQPRSVAGLGLRNALIAASTAASVGTVRRPTGATQLCFQAFSVGIRRRLGRTPRADAMAAYAAQAAGRVGIELTGLQARVAVDLIRVGLGDEPSDKYLPWDRKLMWAFLLDLVRSASMEASEVDNIVALAELRLRALQQEALERRAGWLGRMIARRYRLTPLGEVVSFVGETAPPRSAIGASLKAIARFDLETRDALPDEASLGAMQAVTSLAFHDAVRDRFRADPAREQVRAFAAKVSRLGNSSRVTPSVVEPVVLHALGEPGELPAEVDDLTLEVMVLGFARIVDDLALYDDELDALLTTAERSAEARGFTLTLLAPQR